MELPLVQDAPREVDEGACCPYPSMPPPVDVRLIGLPAHACSYLPERQATSRAFFAGRMSPELYHDFMDAGFRRSGRVVYQPICKGCRRCLSLRVPVEQFRPDKSQRRSVRRNADLVIAQGPPIPTDEKFVLYRKYIEQWHGGELKPDDDDEYEDDRQSFESFLYESPVESIEFTYRTPRGELLAVGICDVSRRSLSSVYFYFDPAQAKRGLGTFGAMHELSVARAAGIPYYYLGYWVRGCAAMQYKANFRPCQLLMPDGRWCDGQDLLGILET
jgi:arginine-tRNA-protein transferase